MREALAKLALALFALAVLFALAAGAWTYALRAVLQSVRYTGR